MWGDWESLIGKVRPEFPKDGRPIYTVSWAQFISICWGFSLVCALGGYLSYGIDFFNPSQFYMVTGVAAAALGYYGCMAFLAFCLFILVRKTFILYKISGVILYEQNGNIFNMGKYICSYMDIIESKKISVFNNGNHLIIFNNARHFDIDLFWCKDPPETAEEFLSKVRNSGISGVSH